MEEDSIREMIKDKDGVELFRELCRHMSTACVEDYYKNGMWQNDLLKLDIEIVDAHRQEAGAPDVIPLSEVPFPDVPAAPKAVFPAAGTMMNMGALRPAMVGGFVRPMLGAGQGMGGMVRPNVVPGIMGARPVNATGEGLLADGTAAADLRQIALFVSKWRLEPQKAKTLLATLNPLRRRFVMQNFKFVQANGSTVTPVGKLEEYITACETSGWDGTMIAPGSLAAVAPPPAAASAAATAAVLGIGVKRPLDITLAGDQHKRPKNPGAAQATVPATTGATTAEAPKVVAPPAKAETVKPP